MRHKLGDATDWGASGTNVFDPWPIRRPRFYGDSGRDALMLGSAALSAVVSLETGPTSGAAEAQPRRKAFPGGSGQVEAIEVHHLVPRGHEVVHELLLRVVAGIDFRQRAKLRVRAEDEVDAGGRSISVRPSRDRVPRTRLRLARPPSRPCPCRARLTKKSLRERPRALGEHAVLRLVRSSHSARAGRRREPSSPARSTSGVAPDRPAISSAETVYSFLR